MVYSLAMKEIATEHLFPFSIGILIVDALIAVPFVVIFRALGLDRIV